jgi:hypothetical protein
MLSGDLFNEQKRYVKSFMFKSLRTQSTNNNVVIIGETGQFSSNDSSFKDIIVTLPIRTSQSQADVQWVDRSGAILKCTCEFQSEFFRTVQLEHDYEEDVMPLEPYDTKELPSPVPRCSCPLSITNAYGEAGIQIVEKRKKKPIPHPKRTQLNGVAWTDDLLSAAMIENFTLLNDETEWKIWLFSADEYVIGDFNGKMLNHEGKKRIGCAIFQHATGWQNPRERRMRLFIYVHEIGHCFNLQHPWNWLHPNIADKKLRGFQTLSWMNYPWMYHSLNQLSGETAFWNAFTFKFSHEELIHLRHGFRNDVICGGNPNTNLATFSSDDC